MRNQIQSSKHILGTHFNLIKPAFQQVLAILKSIPNINYLFLNG